MNKLFIPEKIKVGYQKREDTYTKKLGYVVYFDSKGKLRKETSWEGWRDKGISPDEFENKPTEGFVINRNGGGVRESYGWDARHEFVRVFDPRNFEFEISIANLLYILQESNSIKGKGLEGEFVYGWAGPTLCLLPVNSPEYKNCQEFTEMQGMKVSTKSLSPGCMYETKRQVKLTYMGKMPVYMHRRQSGRKYANNAEYKYESINYHIFLDENGNLNRMSGVSSLAKQLTTEPVENFAQLMDNLLQDVCMSPAVEIVTKPSRLKVLENDWNFYSVQGMPLQKVSDNQFQAYSINTERKWNNPGGTQGHYVFEGFTQSKSYRYTVNPDFSVNRDYNYENNHRSIFGREIRTLYTKEQMEEMEFLEVYVKLRSGALIPLEKFATNISY